MANDILSRRQEWRRKQERRKKALIGVFAALIVVLIFVVIWAGSEIRKIRSNKTEASASQTQMSGENISQLSGDIGAQTESGAASESQAETQAQTLAVAPEDAWMLILVNKTHPIPDGYTIPKFTELRNGHRVDSRIYPDLQRMFDDMRSQGIKPYITSSYRTHEDQQAMMDKKIAEYEASGSTHEDAVKQAEEWVALPGTSEHELGLSVDISSEDKESQNPTAVWEWLNSNCYKYGFVQRYPENKTDITGIIDEPWHYRYVGEKAAQEMTDRGLVLEEYLGMTD